MFEKAIIEWVIGVGIPTLGMIITFISKSKETERRMTIIETECDHLKSDVKDLKNRVFDLEKSHVILGEMNAKLEFITEQNIEMKEDIKALQKSKTEG